MTSRDDPNGFQYHADMLGQELRRRLKPLVTCPEGVLSGLPGPAETPPRGNQNRREAMAERHDLLAMDLDDLKERKIITGWRKTIRNGRIVWTFNPDAMQPTYYTTREAELFAKGALATVIAYRGIWDMDANGGAI